MTECEHIGRRDRRVLRPADCLELALQSGRGHQETTREPVGKPLTFGQPAIRVEHGHLGPVTIGQEVPILVRRTPSATLLRMIRVDRDATAVLLGKEEHARDAPVLHPKRKDAQADVGFEHSPEVADRTVTESETVPFGARNFIRCALDWRSGDVVGGRKTTRKRRIKEIFQFHIPPAEIFEPRDVSLARNICRRAPWFPGRPKLHKKAWPLPRRLNPYQLADGPAVEASKRDQLAGPRAAVTLLHRNYGRPGDGKLVRDLLLRQPPRPPRLR